MPYDSRDLVWPFDAAAVARFLGETWAALGPNLSLHPGDFWWRANLREGRDFRVFEDGNREPIGAHPAHRRKGLSRSLMLEGLRRLRDAGMVAAIVYTGGRNQAARALYEGIGFGVTGLDYDYRKPLSRSVR